MNSKKIFILIFLVAASSFLLQAQVSFMGEDISSGFEKGMELFNKEKYAPSIVAFDDYLAGDEAKDPGNVADARYYSALAALRLFNPDGEYRMLAFISSYPGSIRINDARFALADYFYQNKNYRKAVTYYDIVNRLELTPEQLPGYYFRNGYSQFMKGEKGTALLMFSEIKDIDTEYTSPAIYYFSHIAYEEKKYETALEGFMRLKDDETFGPVVPFYIVQILYLKKDYDGILSLAPGLLKSAGPQRAIELYRFIGDAYYNKGNYSEAISYLEKYSTGAKASAREDKYQLAYCYYKTGETDKAIKIFLDLTASADIMSQNIWCLLGDSYLSQGDKKRAQFAFGQASLMDFDKKLKEESLFNYAKLTFEISQSPFGEAINAFQEYIDLYPGSERVEEAYNYLVTTYLQLKNYKAALASLDKIRNKGPKLEEAYQRVAFFRGLELFRNMEIQASADMFDKSLKYERYNRSLRARAVYWRGEANYRLGRFDAAAADYKTFMGIPGASSLAEYQNVRYNLGYTAFNKQDYSQALIHFRSFENEVANVKPEVMADARNRIADCYFAGTDYQQAISYYDKVIDFGKVDADYAMYQKGFAYGLTNNHTGKSDILSSLITRYPASKYLPAAYFERGRAYVNLKEINRGEADFNQLISSYPGSAFVPRAMVQLGLLYYENGDNQKAITQFKRVIEEYRSTAEARNALTGLKNTYVEMNDVESYFAYVKTLGGYGDVTLSEKDSLMYSSGERMYMAGNCDKATETFRNYISGFPDGVFRLNALYYLADCAKAKGNKDEALRYFIEISEVPNNEFMHQSLLGAADILYSDEDYTRAFSFYEKLEKVSVIREYTVAGLRGQLRASYQNGDAAKTIQSASKIIAAQNIPEELQREALFMSAKANYSLDQNDQALAEFRKIAVEVTSVEGAESKYRVAELQFKKEQIAEAEKTVNEFIDMNTPHQYWMARVFILLSDISVRKGDKIQAIATLRALRESYPTESDGIIDEVKSKLDSLVPVQETKPDTINTGKGGSN